MKRALFRWIAILLVFSGMAALVPTAPARAETNVSGTIAANTTWHAVNSPYIVMGNTLVNQGVTLTIEPGTVVKFNSGKTLQINGALIARGTDSAKITFTSNAATPQAGDWGYILFSDSSTDATYDGSGNYTGGSIMEYCIVEYAGGASVSDNGAVRLDNAHPFINYCTIRNNKASGIYAYNLSGNLKITNNTISNNATSGYGGGIYSYGGIVTIADNVITNNTTAGLGGGIYAVGSCRSDSVTDYTVTISGNTVSNNTANYYGYYAGDGAGICAAYEVIISNNTINSNIASRNGGGIYFSRYWNSGYTSRAYVKDNIIKNNTSSKGGGIYADFINSDEMPISRNIISNNTSSSDGGGIYVNPSGSIAAISGNVIDSNASNSKGGGIYAASNGTMSSISNNSIVRNSANKASAVHLLSVDNKDFKSNTITGNQTTGTAPTYAVYIGSHPLFNYNNIFNNTATYELWNDNAQGSANLDAKNNWWGTVDNSEIQTKIYDWFADSTKGIVDYAPFLNAPDTTAPISPPANVRATANGASVTVTWDANPEGDAAGYRVYYGAKNGLSYANVVDVGNVTSYTLNNVPEGTYIAVTAYDTDYATIADDPATIVNEKQTSGHESWFSREILIDQAGPLNGTIAINNGNAFTRLRDVTLALSASDAGGVSGYYVSENAAAPASDASGWAPITIATNYNGNVTFSLPAADGPKTVYAWFKDQIGNVSSAATGTIILDMTAPTGSFTVNGNTLYTTSSGVTLNLSAADAEGVTAYFVSENSAPPALTTSGWIAVSSVKNYVVNAPFTLSPAEGAKPLYVWFRDGAGNISPAAGRQVILDTTPPTGTISVNGGASATNSSSVTLTLNAADTLPGTLKMAFSLDGTNYTAWEDFNAIKTLNLPTGEGLKTVYVKYKDAAGRESTPYTYSISFDTVLPIPAITLPANGSTVNSLFFITGTVTDALPSSGLSRVELKVTDGTAFLKGDGAWTNTPTFFSPGGGTLDSWSHDTNNVNWAGGASYTITVRATDQAGNAGQASCQFTYLAQTGQAYTTLTMDLSSQTILQNGMIDVTGKLTRLPVMAGINLSGLTIILTVTPPAGGGSPVTRTATTSDAYGHYAFSNLDLFNLKGSYMVQASFAETDLLSSSESGAKTVLVGSSAGYAIIVQGKISNGEGLASHNKTANRIYNKLHDRGFIDENIYYFNYNTSQTGVDASPTKAGIQDAIENWAKGKMNGSPAPLYIILVDHGKKNLFYLDNETISPAELAAWLDSLESNLNPAARSEKRIIIVGTCYSGSFISSLSKENRVIISSAAEDEESFKGPNEPDNIRSGEYFLEELFIQLGRGYSLKQAFEEATRKTEEYTRKGPSAANSPNKYFDNAMQHPLLDDDGNKIGSNVFVEGNWDGLITSNMFLGTGLTYNTNSAQNPAEVLRAPYAIHLTPSQTSATLWLTANDNSEVSSAWVMIRPPSMTLSGTGGTGSGQLEINLTRGMMGFNSQNNRYEFNYDNFTEPGMYEIFYVVIDRETGQVSPMKRSLVYKNRTGNSSPNGFFLLSPENGAITKTVLLFDWQQVDDIDHDRVTYNLVIATDSAFVNEVYRKEEIPVSMAFVDQSAGLKDLTTYYWKVEAVDAYGAVTTSSEVWSFHTDNTNGFPGIITGVVYSDRDYAQIAAATVTASISGATVAQALVDGGVYTMLVDAGQVTIASSAGYYHESSVSRVTVKAGEVTEVNIPMSPSAIPGDLDGSGTVDLADAILALRIVSGINPPSGVTIHKENSVNASGKIGLGDAIYILQKIAGTRAQ